MPTNIKKIVAILHFGGSTFRGTEACVVEAINGFYEKNFDVILLANNPDVITEKLATPPKKTFSVNFPEIMWDDKFCFPIFKWFKALFRLRKLLISERPSVILASGGLPNQLGLPVARLLRIPIAVHFHHPAPKRYFYFWLLPWSDRIIVPSQHTSAVVKEKCKISSTVVYNGIDVTKFHPVQDRDMSLRNKLGISQDAVVIAYVGDLVPHKRVDILLNSLKSAASKATHPLHVIIIGVGSELEKLKELTTTLALENSVTFLGKVPEIYPYLQHVADLHFSASSEEGFGLSVVEAAACGLPNIVSASGALTEVVTDKIDGIHVQGANVEFFAEAILRLAEDKNLREKMGKAGREKAVNNYSLSVYKNKLAEQIEHMASQK